MAIIPFPVGPVCFSEGWGIENASRTGGPAILGQQQFSSSPSGRWRGRMQFHCVNDDDYLEVDGFLAALDGSANVFRLGPADWRGRPWNVDPLTGAAITPYLSKISAKANPTYESNPGTTGSIKFSLAQGVVVNATRIKITRESGGLLRRGQYLSLGDNLHIITSVVTTDPVNSSGAAIAGEITVAIRPWTRAAYDAGTPVEFATPSGLMRLTPDSSAMLDRTTSPLADLSLEFYEAF